ncbi:MAG: hypothetical protein ACK6BM_16030 [Cyanobacteriota bacterium]|jgi:hypothetical protein
MFSTLFHNSLRFLGQSQDVYAKIKMAKIFEQMSLASYLDHLRANPDSIPNGASPSAVVAHAKSVGHDVSEEDIKAFANKGKKDLDSSGGGGCYAQNDDIACGI